MDCPLCCNPFSHNTGDDEPRTPILGSKCGHSYCRGCIKGLYQAAVEKAMSARKVSGLPCPLCRKKDSFRTDQLVANFGMCELIALVHKSHDRSHILELQMNALTAELYDRGIDINLFKEKRRKLVARKMLLQLLEGKDVRMVLFENRRFRTDDKAKLGDFLKSDTRRNRKKGDPTTMSHSSDATLSTANDEAEASTDDTTEEPDNQEPSPDGCSGIRRPPPGKKAWSLNNVMEYEGEEDMAPRPPTRTMSNDRLTRRRQVVPPSSFSYSLDHREETSGESFAGHPASRLPSNNGRLSRRLPVGPLKTRNEMYHDKEMASPSDQCRPPSHLRGGHPCKTNTGRTPETKRSPVRHLPSRSVSGDLTSVRSRTISRSFNNVMDYEKEEHMVRRPPSRSSSHELPLIRNHATARVITAGDSGFAVNDYGPNEQIIRTPLGLASRKVPNQAGICRMPALSPQRPNRGQAKPPPTNPSNRQVDGKVSSSPTPQHTDVALLYLDDIKRELKHRPDIQHEMLEIIEEGRKEGADTQEAARRVCHILRGYNNLILGFNELLPDEHKISLKSLKEMQSAKDSRAVSEANQVPAPTPPRPLRRLASLRETGSSVLDTVLRSPRKACRAVLGGVLSSPKRVRRGLTAISSDGALFSPKTECRYAASGALNSALPSPTPLHEESESSASALHTPVRSDSANSFANSPRRGTCRGLLSTASDSELFSPKMGHAAVPVSERGPRSNCDQPRGAVLLSPNGRRCERIAIPSNGVFCSPRKLSRGLASTASESSLLSPKKSNQANSARRVSVSSPARKICVGPSTNADGLLRNTVGPRCHVPSDSVPRTPRRAVREAGSNCRTPREMCDRLPSIPTVGLATPKTPRPRLQAAVSEGALRTPRALGRDVTTTPTGTSFSRQLDRSGKTPRPSPFRQRRPFLEAHGDITSLNNLEIGDRGRARPTPRTRRKAAISGRQLMNEAEPKRVYGDRTLLDRQAENGMLKLGGSKGKLLPAQSNHPRFREIGDRLAVAYSDSWQPFAPQHAGQEYASICCIFDDSHIAGQKGPFSLFMKRRDLGWEYCGEYKVTLSEDDTAAYSQAHTVNRREKAKMIEHLKSWSCELNFWRRKLTVELLADDSPAAPQWMVEGRQPDKHELCRNSASLAARARALDFDRSMPDEDLAAVLVDLDEFYRRVPIEFVEYRDDIYDFVKGGETARNSNGKRRSPGEPGALASDWYRRLDQERRSTAATTRRTLQ